MSGKLKVALALGHFDGVHKGHAKVIKECVKLARESGLTSVALTFDGDLKGYLSHSKYSLVDTGLERETKLKALGIDTVCHLKVDDSTLSMSKEQFLQSLVERFDIKVFVCGVDFKFGKNALGTVDYLKEFALKIGATVCVVEPENHLGEKISTTTIKTLLSNGEIEGANALLGLPYKLGGKVVDGRRIGRKMGFPTANIIVDKEKTPLKKGVYFGLIELDKTYRAIINYGARPSFNLYDTVMEVHIIDFNGDLYGKEITVSFIKYLRDTKKFNNKEELSIQLEKDLEIAKGIKL
ncbi:MAG: riboflavin biosynthesis protein RibF [Clostridia bacterium]|nr:riboflavin biosynthesis protein RibF [Clostridia bacterium]